MTEQQIVNAICLYIAGKRQVSPYEVAVELMYDDEYGYSAEVFAGERRQILVQANMMEALRMWIDQEWGKDPFAARLQLHVDEEEGIVAFARFGG